MSILERINNTPTRDDHDVFVKALKWRETIERLDELTEYHGEALATLEPFFKAVRAGNVEWDRDGTMTIRCRSPRVAEVVAGILTLRDWVAFGNTFNMLVTVSRP